MKARALRSHPLPTSKFVSFWASFGASFWVGTITAYEKEAFFFNLGRGSGDIRGTQGAPACSKGGWAHFRSQHSQDTCRFWEGCPSEELLSGSSRDEGLVVLQDYSVLSFHGDCSPNPPRAWCRLYPLGWLCPTGEHIH